MQSAWGQKRLLNTLLAVHSAVSVVCGAVAILLPRLFELLLVPHEGDDQGGVFFSHGSESNAEKVVHTVVRLYGVLILVQGWITFTVRAVDDAQVRRGVVQAYAVCFALTTLSLLRAQLTSGGGFTVGNWFNILLFTALTVGYGWFALVKPITVFELPGRSMR